MCFAFIITHLPWKEHIHVPVQSVLSPWFYEFLNALYYGLFLELYKSYCRYKLAPVHVVRSHTNFWVKVINMKVWKFWLMRNLMTCACSNQRNWFLVWWKGKRKLHYLQLESISFQVLLTKSYKQNEIFSKIKEDIVSFRNLIPANNNLWLVGLLSR